LDKSCRNDCKSCDSVLEVVPLDEDVELVPDVVPVLAVLPVLPVPVLAVPVLAVVPVLPLAAVAVGSAEAAVALVVDAVAAVLAAGWLATNWVSAERRAVNSLLPPMLPPLLPSESPSLSVFRVVLWVRADWVTPSSDDKVTGVVVPEIAFVDIIHSLFELTRLIGVGGARRNFSEMWSAGHGQHVRTAGAIAVATLIQEVMFPR
jgi:hypothetical protein